MTRLTSIGVRGMFDEYDLDIQLLTDERITLLHGSNGLGKTTLMRLVYDTLRGAWGTVDRTSFRRLRLGFEDGRALCVANPGGDRVGAITVELETPAGVAGRWQPDGLGVGFQSFPEQVTDRIPGLMAIGVSEWLDLDSGRVLDQSQVTDRFPAARRLGGISLEEPEWLTSLLRELPVRFLPASRLTLRQKSDDPFGLVTVEVFARHLSHVIRSNLAEYAEASTRLEQSFPLRVLADGADPPPEAELRAAYDRHWASFGRAITVGLLPSEPELPSLPDRPLDRTERRLLATFLADGAVKGAVLSDLTGRLEVLQRLFDGMLLRKSLLVDRDAGLVARSSRGADIPLARLSSGEQHLLVIAYVMLFATVPGTLVMLDEPELSLHVAWQQQFIDRMTQIVYLRGMDFLVATHSPHIVHHRWDQTIDLDWENEHRPADGPLDEDEDEEDEAAFVRPDGSLGTAAAPPSTGWVAPPPDGS